MTSLTKFRDRLNTVLLENDTTLAPDADPPKKKKPTKTKAKSQAPEFNLEDPTSKGEVAAPNKGKRSPTAGRKPGKPPGKAGQVRPSTAPVDPEAAGHANDLMNNLNTDMIGPDEISDEEALMHAGEANRNALAGATDTPMIGQTPEPVTPPPPQNLPAVISQAMTRTDFEDVPYNWEPEWVKVPQLPRYPQQFIRSLGRRVFRVFTDTPMEQIWHMSQMAGQSETDVEMMTQWIQQNGVRDDAMTMEFGDVFRRELPNVMADIGQRAPPGYNPQCVIYNTQGYTFLLVRDFMGKYIYAWPGGRGVHLDGGAQPLQIEGKTSTRALVRRLIENRKPAQSKNFFDADAQKIAEYVSKNNVDFDKIERALMATSKGTVKANVIRQSLADRNPKAVGELCRRLVPAISFDQFVRLMNSDRPQ